MSHRQREATPLPFAMYLVETVRAATGSYEVAALWTMKGSIYESIDGVHCYGVDQDATLYCGPWPVICHPPCGPWGRYKHRSRQARADGIIAIELADRYFGVVEQPASSGLFGGGQRCNQSDYGHKAEKATRLYWALPPNKL